MASPNRQYESMLAVARERLSRHTPETIARRAGVVWAGGRLTVSTLGQSVAVTVPDFTVSPALDMWHTLTLLHYLDLADGMPLSGKMMAFAQYPDGMVRGGGFDRRVEQVIRLRLGLLPLEELCRRCLALGAELLPSNADLCARFPFLPRYPLWLRLWFGDEEFPASGRLFLDESAAHYLTVEDAVTVGDLLLERLAGDPCPAIEERSGHE